MKLHRRSQRMNSIFLSFSFINDYFLTQPLGFPMWHDPWLPKALAEVSVPPLYIHLRIQVRFPCDACIILTELRAKQRFYERIATHTHGLGREVLFLSAHTPNVVSTALATARLSFVCGNSTARGGVRSNGRRCTKNNNFQQGKIQEEAGVHRRSR